MERRGGRYAASRWLAVALAALGCAVVLTAPGFAWADEELAGTPLSAGAIAGGETQADDGAAADNAQAGALSVEEEPHVEVFRLYDPNRGEHFYTWDRNERNSLHAAGWRYEGVAWRAPLVEGIPVYRLYSGTDHHYTMNKVESDQLQSAGWSFEGICWLSDEGDAVPLFRLFNPFVIPWADINNSGSHHFTLDSNERDGLAAAGWRAEGEGWYGLLPDPTFVDDLPKWNPRPSGDEWLDAQIAAIKGAHPTLRAMFDYVAGFPYRSGDRFWSNPHYLNYDLTIGLARDMLANGSGNCYRYAGLFCWLARSLGYDANVVSGWVPSYSGGRAPHGWVEVYVDGKTYVCDPDMAHELRGYNWFMVTYAGAPTTYGSW